MKKNEIVFLLVLAVLSGLLLLFFLLTNNASTKAIISIDNQEIATLDLNKNIIKTFTDGHVSLKVEVKNKSIRIIEIDCPNHLCVKQGFIQTTKEKIVCLPNKVIISIEGKNNEENLDGVQ